MKSKKSAAVRALSLTLVIVMLCTTSVFAVEYTSGTASHTAGGYTYNVWSSVYIDGGSKCRAGTWIQTDGNVNVPAYTMGANGRLYTQAGALLKDTGMRYNTMSDYLLFAVTNATTYSGLVYSLGK